MAPCGPLALRPRCALRPCCTLRAGGTLRTGRSLGTYWARRAAKGTKRNITIRVTAAAGVVPFLIERQRVGAEAKDLAAGVRSNIELDDWVDCRIGRCRADVADVDRLERPHASRDTGRNPGRTPTALSARYPAARSNAVALTFSSGPPGPPRRG